MPTDHATVALTNVFVPESAVFGEVDNGLAIAQSFVHENRIRQAASSLGAATYCINEAVKYARQRKPFGEKLSKNQAIQFPLVELATQAEMLRLLIGKTAWEMDRMPHADIEKLISDKVSMCNYWANRLCTEAADRAMQVDLCAFLCRLYLLSLPTYRCTVALDTVDTNRSNSELYHFHSICQCFIYISIQYIPSPSTLPYHRRFRGDSDEKVRFKSLSLPNGAESSS